MSSDLIKYNLWRHKLSADESEFFFKSGVEIVGSAIIKIIFSDYFTDSIFRKIPTFFSKDIETCALSYDNNSDSFKFIFNPIFVHYMNTVNNDYIYFFIFHEVYHFLLEHLTSRTRDKKIKAWNIATDLAINSLLKKDFKKKGWKIPKFGVFPGTGIFSKVEELKSAEYYYALIEDNYENEQIDDLSTVDSHDSWEADDLKSDRVSELTRQIIASSYEEFNSFGESDTFINEYILSSLKDSINRRVNIEGIFKFFIYKSISFNNSSTFYKINKKLPYLYPGSKREKRAKIAISVDQSASITDDMLSNFFLIVKKFLTLTSFDIIPFDTDVHPDKIVQVTKYDSSIELKRKLKGGTDFTPSIVYVNKHSEYDGHIIITDLQAYKPKISSKCPLIWVAPRGSTPYFPVDREKVMYF